MEPEFSRPVSRAALTNDVISRQLEANATERRALSRRFGLAEVALLRASLAVERLEDPDLLRLSGELEARFSEICVVTLDPIPRQVHGPFELLFTLAPPGDESDAEITVETDGEDPPEPVPSEGLDLGEVVAQLLSLHLEPYPRAPRAGLDQASWGAEGEAEPPAESPFAALRHWRG